ncbi:MAG TPA: efflux RND transporter periplasmic adaptor subunit, partial [Thermoanaerobaculia bacterium]|nr:efflux RND transporter periplasmic adaptor subunit [Thermoanaerobaculia bacterium]
KVVQLNAHEGEVVVTGTMNMVGSVIAVIADLSQVLVEADVTETDVVRVKTGQHTRVKVDAVPDKEYVASVVEIGSSAVTRPNQPGVRYFNVKVALDTADDRLRPGMSAQVDIVTDEQKNALSVPVQSVVEHAPSALKKKAGDSSEEDDSEPKRKYVPVIRDEKVRLVGVTTGTSNVTHVMIVSGLKGDEMVVTGPFRLLKKLRDGDSVQVEKGSESAASKSDKNGEKNQ